MMASSLLLQRACSGELYDSSYHHRSCTKRILSSHKKEDEIYFLLPLYSLYSYGSVYCRIASGILKQALLYCQR